MHLPSFIKDFFVPELNAFLKKVGLLIGIVAIMSLSLWSIGFSEGSSEFLKKRMDSPFIKFLSVNIPLSKANEKLFENLDANFSDTSLQNKLGVADHYYVPVGYINFLTFEENVARAKVRMIRPSGSLYSFLFRNSELLLTNEKLVRLDDSPWSAVVSIGFVEELGYTLETLPPYLDYVVLYDGEKPISVPLAIAAVTTQLPDQTDIMLGPTAFYNITNNYERNVFMPANTDFEYNIKSFIETSLSQQEVENIMDACDLSERFKLNRDIAHYELGFTLMGDFNSVKEKQKQSKILNQCLAQREDLKIHPDLAYELVNKGQLRSTKDDYLVLEMTSLDSVAQLAHFMEDQFELPVNLNDIESAKNFNIFNKISAILSIVLTVFTIIILIYIVSKTIIEHIDRNAASLGTLKAFGLSNYTINMVYSGIALLITLGVFLGGFIIAYLLGPSINDLILSKSLVDGVPSSELFKLELKGLYLFSFIIFPFIIIIYLVYRKLHGTTPGDLIYGR